MLQAANAEPRMDIDNIPAGHDFVDWIKKEVSQCDLMLAIIGPNWLDMLNRRAGKTDDFVRIELEAALEQRIPIIPVLVDGAAVPTEAELPETLKPLARRHAFSIHQDHFNTDANVLATKIHSSIQITISARKEDNYRSKMQGIARTLTEVTHQESLPTRDEAPTPWGLLGRFVDWWRNIPVNVGNHLDEDYGVLLLFSIVFVVVVMPSIFASVTVLALYLALLITRGTMTSQLSGHCCL